MNARLTKSGGVAPYDTTLPSTASLAEQLKVPAQRRSQ